MLGLGPTEVLLVTVAAAVLIGPKDVPRLARAAGVATGRATALIARTRRRAFEALEAADVAAVRGDLHASARQLESIRSELRSDMRLMEPLPSPAGGGGGAVQRPHLHSPQPLPSSSFAASSSTSAAAAAAMPFSAASLGRSPARSGPAPTGSDVLADALAEEEVARLGAQFFGGGGGVGQMKSAGGGEVDAVGGAAAADAAGAAVRPPRPPRAAEG